MNDIEKELSISKQLQSNGLITTILKSISEGVIIIDVKGKILFVNKRACELFGFIEQELIGESIDKLIPAAAREKHSKYIQKYFETSINRPMGSGYDLVAIRHDGMAIPVEISLNYLKGEKEALCLAFVSDISIRKKAEKEIQEKNEELTQMNEEIISQRDLLQEANSELEKLNHTKNKFFSIIAHDLRNPFAGMLSSSEMLIRALKNNPENTERLMRNADSLHSSVQNGFKLLENLLEWSRVQRDEIKYNPVDTCITEIIKDSILSLQSFIENKNIKITFDNQQYKVFADKNMLYTIIRNFLSNAVKFTPAGGSINIILKDKNNVLEVIISDTGVGMSEENMAKLFNLEHKNTTLGTQNEKGTGLGLILCKEFVKKNGGNIWVESELEKGSKFYFTLPLVKNITII